MKTLSPFWTQRNLPMENAFSLWKDLDQIFDNFSTEKSLSDELNSFIPAVELTETDKSYVVGVDLPGIKKEEIKIEMFENTLNISGERKREKHFEDKKAQRIERSYGSFRRSFSLPKNADAEKVEAKYENGVLELVIPKIQPTPAKKIEVQ